MQSLATLASALSTLLWPLIFIGLVITFRGPALDLIRSARSRKFTIKIGGHELSMDEANEQQRTLIADLQAQVAEIRNRLNLGNPAEALVEPRRPRSRLQELGSVLWVDDSPKDNSYFIEELGRLGVRVDIAQTTAEAIALFDKHRYGVIISDMWRKEDGIDNYRAGLDLLKAVRGRDPKIAFIIFCGSRSALEHREEAMRLGASGITSSAAELYALLDLEQLRREGS